MKRETIIREKLNKTSFQSQLFFIILVSFVLFEVFAYIVISYTINNRYVDTSLERETEQILELKNSINKKDKSLLASLNEYKSKTDNTVLVLNTSSGGFLLEDCSYEAYKIKSSNSKTFVLPSYDVELEEGDLITVYYKENDVNKTVRKIKKNNKIIFSQNYKSLISEDIVISKIEKPSNLNFLYLSSEETSFALNALENSYTSFVDITIEGAVLKKYQDTQNGYFCFLLVPDELKSVASATSVIFVIAPITETKLLLNVTSVTFIFIVIVSLAVAVLIAVFISNAFSNPIKLFEKEMRSLNENNYRLSQYKFRNKEMISLESTLNEVKQSISSGIESINKQKRDLEKLNKKLLNEEELRSSFVQRLSHELKTPLMIISATTEALESGLIDKGSELQSYETILNEVDKTTEIIKEIINNYNTIAKKQNLTRERFNLNALVEEVLSPLVTLAKANGLTIKENLNNACYINANRDMIKTVISNFITNAIKYTPKNNTIEVNIVEDETKYIFEVINYGSCIEEDNIDKIWLPFFREKEDVDSSSTGMGLYIVKTTLESHGYDYDVVNIDNGVKSYFEVKK